MSDHHGASRVLAPGKGAPATLPWRVRLAKWYLALAPVRPPDYYQHPVPLLRAREEHADERQGGFAKWFGGRLDLRGQDVLDLGSGYGGRTVAYKEAGARSVVGMEIVWHAAAEGAAFARERDQSAHFAVAVGESMPFGDRSFDVITAYDVLEHVQDVTAVLRECRRVLRPGGTLYAVFPPFYHPEGTHLEGFVSRMPYPHLLFSPSTLMRAAESIMEEGGYSFRPAQLRPGDRMWTLNGVGVRSFKRMVAAAGFSRARVDYAPLFSPLNRKWGTWRMKYYAPLFRPLRLLPGVNEVFVHRIVCELTR